MLLSCHPCAPTQVGSLDPHSLMFCGRFQAEASHPPLVSWRPSLVGWRPSTPDTIRTHGASGSACGASGSGAGGRERCGRGRRRAGGAVGGAGRGSEAERSVLVRANENHCSERCCFFFPECVAKGSRLTLWGSGGRALFAKRCFYVRNRPQPSATVRNRSQPFATVRNRSR